MRSVAVLKLTGRNEGEPRKTLGEAIHAVFADCCEAGSAGDLEETDPVVLSALDGWLNLDIALDELPTGTRDELCVQAFTQALEDIEKLHAQVRARLSVQQIQGLLDAAILTAKELGQGHLDSHGLQVVRAVYKIIESRNEVRSGAFSRQPPD